MAMIIYILAGFLGILCLLILFILVAPFRYRFQYAYDGMHKFETGISIGRYISLLLFNERKSLRTLHGYVRVGFFKKKMDIALDKQKEQKKQGEQKKQEEQKKQKDQKDRKDRQEPVKVVKLVSKPLIEDVFHALQDIIKIILPEYVNISGRIGFYEPHHTAFLLALTGAATEHIKILNIYMEPVWEEEYFNVKIDVAGKIILMAIIFRCVRLLLSKSSRNTWKRWRTLRKAGKVQHQS